MSAKLSSIARRYPPAAVRKQRTVVEERVVRCAPHVKPVSLREGYNLWLARNGK